MKVIIKIVPDKVGVVYTPANHNLFISLFMISISVTLSHYFLLTSFFLSFSPILFSFPHFHIFSFLSSFFFSSFEPLLFFFYLLLNLNLFLFYLEIIEIIIGERGCPHWCLLYVISFNPGVVWEGDREWVWVCVRRAERKFVSVCVGEARRKCVLQERGGRVRLCVWERGGICVMEEVCQCGCDHDEEGGRNLETDK